MAAANIEARMRGMMEAAARPEPRANVGYGIVAGAAIVAVIVGVGITAADYPWHLTAKTKPARDMEKAGAAVALAPKLVPRSVPRAVPKAASIVVPTVVSTAAPIAAPTVAPTVASIAAPIATPIIAAATDDSTTLAVAPAATKVAEKVQSPPARNVAKRKSAKPPSVARQAPAAQTVAERPRRNASQPQSVDVRYVREITRCKSGLTGLPCREAAKWRLCAGRWSMERNAGETRCHIGPD